MADNIDRQHVTDAMDWVEAEQVKKNRLATEKKHLAEMAKMRQQAERVKCIALNEMYSAIVCVSEDFPYYHGTKICHMALAMVEICAKIGYVDTETKRNLQDYLYTRLNYFARKGIEDKLK